MSARIVVFGATGYTGEELVARGAQPVLAGRSAQRLQELPEDTSNGSSRTPHQQH